MLNVNKYSSINSNIISYKNFNYNKIKLPDNIQLILDIIDDETENILIKLIKENNSKLKTICKCINDNVFKEKDLNFNDYQFSILNKGKGMPIEKDSNKYGNTIAILNMGTDILYNLRNTKKNIMHNIVLPRKSLLIITDTERIYDRSISQRFEDIIDYKTTIIREDRYSIVFRKTKY
jgi:hypothetical protein